MPYEHTTTKGSYVLHKRDVALKGGRTQTIYFFTKRGNTPKSGHPCDMPHGKQVGINKRTGLPYLANA